MHRSIYTYLDTCLDTCLCTCTLHACSTHASLGRNAAQLRSAPGCASAQYAHAHVYVRACVRAEQGAISIRAVLQPEAEITKMSAKVEGKRLPAARCEKSRRLARRRPPSWRNPPLQPITRRRHFNCHEPILRVSSTPSRPSCTRADVCARKWMRACADAGTCVCAGACVLLYMRAVVRAVVRAYCCACVLLRVCAVVRAAVLLWVRARVRAIVRVCCCACVLLCVLLCCCVCALLCVCAVVRACGVSNGSRHTHTHAQAHTHALALSNGRQVRRAAQTVADNKNKNNNKGTSRHPDRRR